MKALRQSRRGSAAVEFALVLLPMLLLLFGILEFGRFIWTKNAVQQTAIATARCMGVNAHGCSTSVYSSALGADVWTASVASAVAYAISLAGSYHTKLTSASVVATTAGLCAGQTGFSKVTITTTFTPIVPLMNQFLGTATSIVGSACFPNQG